MATRIMDLQPGDVFRMPDLGLGDGQKEGIFVGRLDHPLYGNLQLVLWRMADGTWHHDALSAFQELDHMGEVLEVTPKERRENVVKAFRQ